MKIGDAPAMVVDRRILEASDDLDAFRGAVRAWLAEAVPPGALQRMAEMNGADAVELQRWWMAEAHKVGLGTPHWPKEYGGAGLSLAHQVILAEENARAQAPVLPVFLISMIHLPGTLLAWGSEEQKRRYLPGIPAGDIWCQGFSEPGAGSDLASLRTRAERRGDHYVVNGHKIWSTQAMFAKRCILLARTDPDARKQAGISFFLMDMQAPGVEVRPIRQANGRSDFAELFLNDVKIPVEDLVGPENAGWSVAQSTLASERGVIAFEFAERSSYALEAFYRKSVEGDAAWLRDDQLRRGFIDGLLELQVHRRMVRRLLRAEDAAEGETPVLPSYVKLHGANLRQRLSSLMTRMAGLAGQERLLGLEEVFEPAMYTFLTSFSWTIAGGSNEIMRNIISERGLGMPRG